MAQKIVYYHFENEDFIHSKNKDVYIKPRFKWIHQNIFYRALTSILSSIFTFFAFIYTKVVYNTKIVNKKLLKGQKNYFLYINHTHPFADVLNPFVIAFPHKPAIIISKENLGIPIIGKLLPLFGTLPIPDDIHQMQKFTQSINYYLQKGKVITIYPEAHVWPYCTFIRHFPQTSFQFPVQNNAKVFTATTTYHPRKFFKKPKIIIYIDGPFVADNNLETKKAKAKDLNLKVYNAMQSSSQKNTLEYIKYILKD